ncbi:hypothetical protein AVEN_69110-1 [Araneus ventricosus]|uniref:Tc1-like transposase DDE domain-containing protein n=1 Tax=Araneus ventricosus TaxID=182803 RepID=A0A4Y2WYU9_ARAVE|nr:hypothetical protein AVEN_69110-1 [Araneus ventricosus]
MGLSSRRPTRVPLLAKRHSQLRLQWAREHRDWTMDEWKRVAWSDESRFLIHLVDGRVRVRRLLGERLLPSCTAGHTQSGAGGNGIFQQDNAPCHKPRIVLEWFEEHTDEFHLMSWPPKSSDINPMENIWNVMKRQLIYHRESLSTTMSEYLDFA